MEARCLLSCKANENIFIPRSGTAKAVTYDLAEDHVAKEESTWLMGSDGRHGEKTSQGCEKYTC